MISRTGLALAVLSILPSICAAAEMVRPKAGPVQIMKSAELKRGMKGTAWTVFVGSTPEAVPVEIIGLWKNAWGPGQDVIIGKMGGQAQRTNVAGGMSGSPVYIDGKLIGAVALRLSVFSPDSICGITPIELMLEINDFDKAKPADARVPGKTQTRAGLAIPGDLLSQVVSAGATPNFQQNASTMLTPIDTPLTFSGFDPGTLQNFGPLFQQLGFTAVQGGASAALNSSKPAAGWQNALQPGDAVAGVLVSGDMGITGLGTVTYNDGKRVLAFGHPFFNLGPVEMPMSKGEVLMVLSSAFQPNKFANATEIVGMLTQDRHSGIMGRLGDEAAMIPVDINVRSFGEDNKVMKQKKLHFNVFVHQKWTPYLMMVTLYNSINGINDFAEEATYRMSGKVKMDGAPDISLSTIQSATEAPAPAAMVLAGWWGDKFNRLFLNSVQNPKLKSVNVNVDLLPDRRVAAIENAWTPTADAAAGSEIPVKVFLRPYRGERLEQNIKVKLPIGLAKGEHRILLSDADTLNRLQAQAGMANRYIDVPQTASLINQERSNNRLYVSLVESQPTVYSDDKAMPSLPGSVLNIMQGGRSATRQFITTAETAIEQASIPFDYMVSGSYSLRFTIK